jgi:hypothetical protein
VALLAVSVRIWQRDIALRPGKAPLYASTYASDEAGTFIVTVEFPNLQALAEAAPRIQASAEWQQVIGGLMASGFRPSATSAGRPSSIVPDILG